MIKTVKVSILVAISIILLSQCVFAAKPYDVTMGGYLLLRIRSGSGQDSVKARGDIIQARANNVLSCYNTGDLNIQTMKSGSSIGIYANNDLFITVTPQDAKDNKTTVRGLADVWAAKLADVSKKAMPNCKPIRK